MTTAIHQASRDAFRQARAWGWPFALGLAALALALVVSLVVVPRLQHESQAIGAEADHTARQARLAATASPGDRPGESAPAHFVSAFPPVDARQARVAALLELALHHSMELRRSEFQLNLDKGSGLLRYSVTMPLAGSYAQLRGFVEDALAADAALSLDRLRLRRATAGTATIEADLTWSFYMRPGGAAPTDGSR